MIIQTVNCTGANDKSGYDAVLVKECYIQVYIETLRILMLYNKNPVYYLQSDPIMTSSYSLQGFSVSIRIWFVGSHQD